MTTAATAPPVVQLWKRLRKQAATRAPGGPERDFRRIRRAVIGFAATVALLTVVIVVQSSLQDRRERLDAAQSQALNLARAVGQYSARVVESSGQYLYDLRSSVEAAGGVDAVTPERLAALLETPRLHDAATRRAFLADAEGVKRTVGPQASAGPVSVSRREYFLAHLERTDRSVLVTAPFRARSDGRWIMPLSVRIDRADGSFAGVATVALDVSYLLRYFRSLGVPNHGSIALITAGGRFLVRYPRFEQAVGVRIVDRKPAYSGVEGLVESESSPVDGAARIVAFNRVAGYPVYAVVTFSRNDLLDGWVRNNLLRAAIGGAIIGLLSLFAVLILMRLDGERLACLTLLQFQRAVDQSGDLVYWIAEDGRIVYLNEEAARRHSPQPTVPAGLTAADISLGYTPELWARLCGKLKREGAARYRGEHSRRDGRSFPVDLSASYQEIEGAGYVFLIGRDRSAD